MALAPEPQHLRRRRLALLGAGVLFIPIVALDTLLPNTGRVALAGGTWVGALLLGGLAQRSASPLVRGLGVTLAALVGIAALGVKASLTGGTASVYFPGLLVYPLVMLVVVPDLPLLIGAAGLASLVTGVVVRMADGRSPGDVLFWVALSASVMGLAVPSAVLARRQQRREVESERARAEALQALAESERRRGEAERLAAVGRLAASVSHEMTNPLASVAANLRWLEREGGADPEERREVLEDLRGGVDRLVDALGKIRDLSYPNEPGAPGPEGGAAAPPAREPAGGR